MSEEKPKRAVTIDPGRMKLAEFERQDWIANAPQGATIDDIKEPGFWSLMAAKMKPYDRIEVRVDDGTWLAEVIVLGCDRTWARVHVLNVHKLTSSDVSITQAMEEMKKHEVLWRGPQHKWCVKRLSDNAVVKDQCDTKDEAAIWLKEHEKVV